MKDMSLKIIKITKNINLTLLLIFVIFSSCKTSFNNLYSERIPYRNKLGDKNIYPVDTIRITTPVSFTTIDGQHRVIMDEAVFLSLDSYNDDVLKTDGVFLYEIGLTITPIELLDIDPDNASVRYDYEKILDSSASIGAIKYSNPFVFVMFLIKQELYNTYFTGIDGPSRFKSPEVDHMYLPMLVPLKN